MSDKNNGRLVSAGAAGWVLGALAFLVLGSALGVCTGLLEKQNARIIRQNKQLSRQLAATRALLATGFAAQGKSIGRAEAALLQQSVEAAKEAKAKLAAGFAAQGKLIRHARYALLQQSVEAAKEANAELAAGLAAQGKLIKRTRSALLQQSVEAAKEANAELAAGFAAQEKSLGHARAAMQQQVATSLASIGATLSARLAKQDELVSQIRTGLQQQTAVTYAALGKVIPAKMPTEFNRKLAAAERAATDLSAQQPPALAEVNRNIHVVALLVRQLPPWARTDYLPRFNALRWALATEYLLAVSGARQDETAAEISDSAENLIHQMNSVPNPTKRGVTAATLSMLFADLKAEARVLQSRATELIYRSARAGALACLENPKLSPSVALENLRPWKKSREHGHDASLLARKLYILVAERQAGEIMKRFHRVEGRLNGRLLAVALGNAYNNLAALEISLAARGLHAGPVVEAGLEEYVTRLRKIARHEAAKRTRMELAYQAWALKQIRRYRRAQEDFDNQRHWYKLHKYIADKYYKEVRDAMVDDLLPIRSGLLRRGVASLFSKAWAEGWKTLSGREDQTYVAEQAAVVRQLSPLDVWKKEHPK